jgi:hypothetical protein
LRAVILALRRFYGEAYLARLAIGDVFKSRIKQWSPGRISQLSLIPAARAFTKAATQRFASSVRYPRLDEELSADRETEMNITD